MTPGQCQAKRNEHLALARQAEGANNHGLGNWHRLFAKNFELMASDDPAAQSRGIAMLKLSTERYERDMLSRRS